MNELDNALAYLRNNLPEYELAIISANVDRAYSMHLNPSHFVDEVKIIDLLEEYGQDNDLPEEWWSRYADIDDIVLELTSEPE